VTQNIGPTEHGDSRAQEASRDQAGKVSEQAQRAGASIRDQVRRQLDDRSTLAGEQVAAMARAMRDMGGQLRSQGNDGPGRVSEEAAERVERLGRYLHEADGGRIMADIEDVGRRQPWVVAAAGLAAGAMAARFLKASSRKGARHARHARQRWEDQPGPVASEAPA
jgi:hypothetical protein